MRIRIDFRKTAQDNANDYYSRAKKLALKKEGAAKAVAELQTRLVKAEKEGAASSKEIKITKAMHREWYEKFHWFHASNGMLAIGGRDAHQNELLNSKHFDDKDLFFHANIFGASVTVLKDGIAASAEVKLEAAQFAACYSSAWKDGLNTVDVYAMTRAQVSKSTSKGSLGTGSFLLSGEREWFRGTRLALIMFVKDNVLQAVPEITFHMSQSNATHVKIGIGKEKKSDAAKRISKMLDFPDTDTIMQQLPSGSFNISSRST